jgi:hypothetical protein
MNLRDLKERLALAVFQPEGDFDAAVSGGYAGDLLSDVMGNAKEHSVWITCQTHENIVAVARLKNLAGIILVNSRKPEDSTMGKARDERVILLGTPESAFTISGALAGLLGRK